MFDDVTRGYVNFAFRNLPLCAWRMIRQMNRDTDAERRELCRNLVCSMPSPYREQYAREIDWIVRNGIARDFKFPYDCRSAEIKIDVGVDATNGLPYAMHRGHKLYFPKGWGFETVRGAYYSLLYEEGLTGRGLREKSPHAYVADDFDTTADDVLLDVGCAEALFSLDKISEVKKAYLFEGLKKWRRPLFATFVPFKDKVVFSNKFVGDGTRGTSRLQDVVQEHEDSSYFIKMDIEGAEREVLKASADFLRTHRVKLSCCVYHRQDDAEVISNMLTDLGFRWKYSEGWMLPDFNGFHFPYFRRGVIHARNF